MFEFLADNPFRFLLALVIGLATAWWIWAQREREAEEDYYEEEEDRRLAPLPDPEAEPEPLEVSSADEVEEIAIDPEGDPDEDPYPLATALAATAAITPDPEEDKRPNIAAAVGESDDLTRINGIGPKLHALCNALGIRRFDQIAKWDEADIAEVDAYLGGFKGRIERDRWVPQAKLLALGHIAEWESQFGYKS